MAMIGDFRWNFPKQVTFLLLALARLRSKKSVMAMIGDFHWNFPNRSQVIASFGTIAIQ